MRLRKSDGRTAAPDICLTEAWKRVATERKEETRGLVENSPRHSSSNTGFAICENAWVVVELDDVSKSSGFGRVIVRLLDNASCASLNAALRSSDQEMTSFDCRPATTSSTGAINIEQFGSTLARNL